MLTVVVVVVYMEGEESRGNLFILAHRRVSFCFCHEFRAPPGYRWFEFSVQSTRQRLLPGHVKLFPLRLRPMTHSNHKPIEKRG